MTVLIIIFVFDGNRNQDVLTVTEVVVAASILVTNLQSLSQKTNQIIVVTTQVEITPVSSPLWFFSINVYKYG